MQAVEREGRGYAVMLRDDGAENVIVTRAHHPTLLVDRERAYAIHEPAMEGVDARGAGDSFTAALAVALVEDEPLREAARLGADAGALNVTRHRLGTGDADAIRRLSERVGVREIVAEEAELAEQVTPDQLAARTEVDPK